MQCLPFVVVRVGFVEPRYTFVENQPFGVIEVRKDAASATTFQVRVTGGEKCVPIRS